MKKIILFITFCLAINAMYSQQTSLYSLWYEFGNGTFILKSFNSTTDFQTYVNNNLPPLENLGASKGIKKGVPIYMPGNSVFSEICSVRLTNPTQLATSETTSLPGEGNLFVHTSTRDFLSKDTVLFALQYISTNPSNKKLAFFYNSNSNPTFSTISNTTSTYLMPTENSGAMISVNKIRTYNNEVPSIANPNLMRSVGMGYQNGLVFDLTNGTANLEKNIFLTMNTLENIVLDNNENFKLVFLDADNHELESTNNELLNHSKLKSHDPNYEKVNPECVEYPTGAGTILNYNVHFQNTGLGAALKVETTTQLPNGYTINDIQHKENIEWEIAKQKKNKGYTIDVSASHDDKLIIKFTRKPSTTMILKGTLGLANPLNDVKTMGDFSFELKLKTPLIGPEDLKSHTSIIFDKNEPVVTNEAVVRIRKCCSCKEKKKNKHENSSKPCKSKGRLLQWLLCEDC